MLLDGHMLHLELAAGVTVMAHAHGLWEVPGRQLLRSGLILSPLHFAWFHQISSFVNVRDSYCNIIAITEP